MYDWSSEDLNNTLGLPYTIAGFGVQSIRFCESNNPTKNVAKFWALDVKSLTEDKRNIITSKWKVAKVKKSTYVKSFPLYNERVVTFPSESIQLYMSFRTVRYLKATSIWINFSVDVSV